MCILLGAGGGRRSRERRQVHGVDHRWWTLQRDGREQLLRQRLRAGALPPQALRPSIASLTLVEYGGTPRALAVAGVSRAVFVYMLPLKSPLHTARLPLPKVFKGLEGGGPGAWCSLVLKHCVSTLHSMFSNFQSS